ncbi:hypothetical protein [Pseudacidovorax intermedius]|uniref:hypothetical protein n=1 Tax=Pseudacidovorax intermedius TaxID=433924 RepID=UPI0026EC4566|nr:hypothetical protein [Pseudacidovorax intermedius]
MVILTLLILSVLVYRLKGAGKLLHAGGFFVLVNYISLWTYFIHQIGLVHYEDFVGLPMPINSDYSMASVAYMCGYYMLVSFVVAPNTRKRKIEPLGNSQFSPRGFKMLALAANVVAVLVLYVALAIYITEANFQLIFRNYSYLFLVNANNVGLQSRAAILLHDATGILGVALGAGLAIFLGKKKFGWALLYAPIYIFCVVIKYALFSRWVALQLAAFLIVFAAGKLRRRAKFGRSILLLLLAAFIFVVYISTLAGRYGQAQGISAVYAAVIDALSNLSIYLEFVVLNVFGGSFVFLEAAAQNAAVYNILFKITSFSPLPAVIDGWDYWRAGIYMINQYTPYNVAAELFYFGVPFWILYLIIIKIAYSLSNKIQARYDSSLGFVVASPLYIYAVMFGFYGVRFGSKLIYISIVIALSVIFLKRQKRKISSLPAEHK